MTCAARRSVNPSPAGLTPPRDPPNPRLFTVKHAAMAQLVGFDIVQNEKTGDIPVTVIAFAPPKVGNGAVAARVDELFPKLRVLRVRNPEDTVCNCE